MFQAAAFFAWLYFWLSGHWFGRVMAFIFFGLFLSICETKSLFGYDATPLECIFGVVAGWILAWLLASLPTYCRRPGFWRRLGSLRLPVLYSGEGTTARR